MTRREFSLAMGGSAIAAAQPQTRRIAITMDDFNWRDIPGGAEKANRVLLDTFAKHSNLKITLFVCGRNVEDPRGRQLLRAWNDAGHTISNHTYSHQSYNSDDVTFAAFSKDALRCEPLIREFSGFRKLFRFPALKEGDSVDKRDRMRDFLAKHGYRNGHVTVDNSDWYYNRRLGARLEKDPGTDPNQYRDVYLEHMLQSAAYYDDLARKVTGRSVDHTLLVHYTLLNSLFLDGLLTRFESRGWQLISSEAAYKDPVFLNQPNIVPAGESLIWQMAKASPQAAELLRYPGESLTYEKEKLDRLGL